MPIIYSQSRVPIRSALTSYTTTFPATENPISEGGKWLNGLTDGGLWNNVKTVSNHAVGTVVLNSGLDDNVCLLKSSFISLNTAQYAKGTVHRAGAYTPASNQHETEFFLNAGMSNGNLFGYEINFGINQDGTAYTQIIRWNGGLGSFDPIDSVAITALVAGDVIGVDRIGNIIASHKNGSPLFSADVTSIGGTVWTGGVTGMGFYPNNGSTLTSYGWASFETGNGAAP